MILVLTTEDFYDTLYYLKESTTSTFDYKYYIILKRKILKVIVLLVFILYFKQRYFK